MSSEFISKAFHINGTAHGSHLVSTYMCTDMEHYDATTHDLYFKEVTIKFGREDEERIAKELTLYARHLLEVARVIKHG